MQDSRMRLTWIIPARAGFTHLGDGPADAHQDHPRSRGVYGIHQDPVRTAQGSSPLARGLRNTAATVLAPRGIIPARAGFTPTRCARTGTIGDHPRSRGVYLDHAPTATTWPGSSPLARGLREQHERLPLQDGIIPARAGFTLWQFCLLRFLSDHPRSRGVYHGSGIRLPYIEGSSPLARGLLGKPGERPAERRIIPARAGFTILCPQPITPPTDHPRSRGVYSWRAPTRPG